ncbi:MAG: hypothetical protein P9M14_03375 [Candidatus Alcyoniella australis]|nr:hypothetical protein [Candidatus Alcyoniella australis]
MSELHWLMILWLKAFVFTLAVEVPIFVLFARGQVPLWRAAVAGAAGTCLTHPLLWFAWPMVIPDNYELYLATGESLVVLIETLTFWLIARPISLGRAACASLVANAASWGLGTIVDRLL